MFRHAHNRKNTQNKPRHAEAEIHETVAKTPDTETHIVLSGITAEEMGDQLVEERIVRIRAPSSIQRIEFCSSSI